MPLAQGTCLYPGVLCPEEGDWTSLTHFSLALLSLAGHMTDLIYAEKDLVQSLKEYILVEEAKLSKIKRCLSSYVPTPTLSQSSCLHWNPSRVPIKGSL